jgi:hypothetical protein
VLLHAGIPNKTLVKPLSAAAGGGKVYSQGVAAFEDAEFKQSDVDAFDAHYGIDPVEIKVYACRNSGADPSTTHTHTHTQQGTPFPTTDPVWSLPSLLPSLETPQTPCHAHSVCVGPACLPACLQVVGPNKGGFFGEAGLDTQYITASGSGSPTYFLSQARRESRESETPRLHLNNKGVRVL